MQCQLLKSIGDFENSGLLICNWIQSYMLWSCVDNALYRQSDKLCYVVTRQKNRQLALMQSIQLKWPKQLQKNKNSLSQKKGTIMQFSIAKCTQLLCYFFTEPHTHELIAHIVVCSGTPLVIAKFMCIVLCSQRKAKGLCAA